jgi:hypothetical protein
VVNYNSHATIHSVIAIHSLAVVVDGFSTPVWGSVITDH